MSVFRVNKNSNYTIMSNYHFRDNRLSLKAKGLLSEMLSLPDDWDYSLAGLVAINKEEEKAIKSAIDELKDCGYVVVTKFYPESKERTKIEYVYDIFEVPNQPPQNVGLQEVVLQDVGLQKDGQLNTKKQNTNNKQGNRKKPIYDHTSIPYRAAKWLSEQIMERLPEQKAYTESDLQRWADDFRLMNTSDGYEWELIEKVLQYSQEDYFWSQNILSASKFRKQFSTLLAKAKASGYV